jgi:hypothetical protein
VGGFRLSASEQQREGGNCSNDPFPTLDDQAAAFFKSLPVSSKSKTNEQ